MKRLFVFSGIIIVLFITLVLLTNVSKEIGESKNQISVEKLEEEILMGKDYFVYFYQTDCIYCKATSPVVIPMAEEMNADMKEVNLQEDTSGWKKFNVEGTPTIIRFKEGQEISRIHGQRSEEDFRQWFEENK